VPLREATAVQTLEKQHTSTSPKDTEVFQSEAVTFVRGTLAMHRTHSHEKALQKEIERLQAVVGFWRTKNQLLMRLIQVDGVPNHAGRRSGIDPEAQ
jgi:hypothetical protein